MLERVTAALTKFLAPVTSSLQNGLDSTLSTKEEFQRFKKKDKEEPKTSLEIGKKSDPTRSESHLKLVPPPAEELTQKTAAFTSAITEIFAQFRGSRKTMLRWGGGKTYEASLRSKSMSQLRKGTIFDEKAE